MAVEVRPELVGKRFLCVSREELVEPAEIARWRWRAGVIRAVSHRDSDNPDLMVYVEFDDLEWEKREWIKVYEEYRVFLLENRLVWAWRKDTSQLQGSKGKQIQWPALTFRPIVGKAVLGSVTVVEFLSDRRCDFLTDDGAYWQYEDEAASLNPVLRDNLQLHQEVSAWVKEQKVQDIFMRGPYSLNGHRVQVYRQDSATQWFTGIITNHDIRSRMMIVMNDQVLEPQNVDPSMVQMTFLDDVVHSLLKGENIGIASRRRTRTSQNNSTAPTAGVRSSSTTGSPQGHYTRTQAHSPRPLMNSSSSGPVSQNSPGQQRSSPSAVSRDSCPDSSPLRDGADQEGKDPSQSKSEQTANKRRKPEDEKEAKSDLKRLKVDDEQSDRALGSYSESSCGRTMERSVENESKSKIASGASLEEEQSLSSKRPEEAAPTNQTTLPQEDEETWTETLRPAVCEKREKTPPTPCNINSGGTSESQGCTSGTKGTPGTSPANLENSRIAVPVMQTPVDVIDITEDPGRSSAAEEGSAPPASSKTEPGLSETRPAFSPTSNCRSPESMSHISSSLSAELPYKQSEVIISPRSAGGFPASAEREKPQQFPTALSYVGNNSIAQDGKMSHKPNPSPDVLKPKPSPSPDQTKPTQNPSPEVKSKEHTVQETCKPKSITAPEMAKQKARHHENSVGAASRPASRAELDDSHSGFKPVPTRGPAPEPTKSPLIIDKNQPFTIYRDPALIRSESEASHFSYLHAPHLHPLHPSPRSSCSAPSPHHPSHLLTSPSHIISGPSHILPSPSHTLPSPSHILQSPSPQPSIGSVSAHAIPSIHHPHLLPGMLHGLPPASLLGGHPRLDSAHTGRLGALGLAQPPPPPSPTPASSYNHLGLYPIVWQYPNGSHPYPALGLPSSKWGHPPEGAVSSEPCLRRNSPSPWLHQHAPVTSSSAADSLGLLSHVPVRPSSADPHMTPRVHPHASPPPANLATRVHSHTGSPPANLSSRINPHASPPPANLPSRIQSHTSPPLSKSTEEMEKKAFFEPMQAFTSVYSKLEQDRMRAPGGRDRHLHFLEGLPGQGKQQRAPQESGDRASKYKEESRRILQESIEVAPYTAKIRPSEAERETYPGALPSLPPPSTKRHALHRDTDPSPSTSDLYGLKAPLPRPGYFTTLSNSVVNEPPHPHPHLSQELGSFFERAGPSPLSQPPFSSKAPSSRPPPLIRHQPEGGEGLVGKITEQLSQQHTPPLRPLCVMGNDGRSPLISMSSPSSAPSPLRGMPSLYRAPVFHPPTQHAPSRRLSPPTLTPIQPVSSTGAGLGLGAGVILDQQRPPTLVPELREAGGSGGPHRAPSEGRRSREMGNAKPQSATASVIVRPSVCVKCEGSPGSKAVGSNLMDCRDPGGAVLLKGSSEDVSAWYRSCVTETQRAVPGPVMALSNTLLDAKAHAASPAILPPSTIDQGDSVTEHTREKTEFPNPSAGVTSVMEQKEGKVQAPSSSLSYPSRFVHPKKHKAALAAAQSRNTNDNPSEGAKSPPLPSVSLPPQPSPITQGNNSPGNATDKTNCLTNGQPQSAQLSQPNYHKLKKAWLTRHSEEDRNASVKAEKAESSVSEIIKPCTVSLTASTSSHLETGKDDKEQEKEATGQEEGKTRRAAKRSYESGSESAPDDDSDGSQSEQRAKRQPKPTYKKKQNDLRKRRNHNDKEEDGEEEEDGGSKPNAIFRSAKEKIKLKLANSNGIPRSVLKDWRKVRKLKQTGESFLQDDSCCEIGPNLQKCRECRLVRSRKGEETGHSPVFCRFYYFRRLSYSKNGVVKIDGFSFPDQYDDEAVSMWTPSTCEDNELDLETSKYILSYIGDKFCQLAMSENTAATSNKKNASMAWKRAVRGVREMCDACEATLFNLHWVCQKCGFVVCLDCYKAKERKGSKEKDLYSWLKCVKGQPHDHKQLMPTQIIPGTVLTDLVNSMHALREKFGIKSHCACSGKLNKIPSTNGVSQVLQNVLNHSNKMSLCKPHGGQEEPPLKVEAESKQALPESQSPLHFLADLAEQKSREEKKENKESPVGMVVVVKEAQDQNEGVEGLNCKPTAMGISSTEQGSTLRDLLTTTAGKLRMGSTDAGMAFAPVYCSSTQTSKSSRSMPNILDDIIASVVENKIPAGKALRPRPKQEVSEEAQAENRKPGVDDPKTPALPLDSPHTWLYGRRLLWLRDHRHPGNCRLFRESWEQGQPVLVSGVHKKLKASLWKAESFNQEFADHQGDLLNCKDGVVSVSGIKEFWDGFEDLTKRPRCKGGDTAVYRLKDWPSGEEFMALMPSRYDDLMTNLPLPEYSDPEGSLNLASRLPSFFVRPDLGPRLCCAYGVVASQEQDFGTSNLHLEVSDIVSILVYVGVAKGNGVLSKTGVLKRLEEEDLDDKVRKRLKDSSEIPGALWHIYMSKDAEKIKEFLNKVSREQGGVSEQDPIREPGWYLNRKLRQRLLEEQGVQAWTVLQFLGDSVIIPAGALHQVQNLHSCVQVINDFVSPEHVVHSFHLTQELRSSSEEGNYEDKLQVKNIFYHSVKDAVGTLKRCCMEDPDESEDNS